MATTTVDPEQLRLAALRLDTAADLLTDVLDTHLARVQYGATFSHGANGVRAVVDQLVADVAHWQRGARDGAAGLRMVAERHIRHDEDGAEALR